MEFCPTCSNLLRFGGGAARFYCLACPYICSIEPHSMIKRKQPLVKKQMEPIFTDDDIKEGSITDAWCEVCCHGKAYFREFQTRSGADEPMTTFYLCANCNHRWNK